MTAIPDLPDLPGLPLPLSGRTRLFAILGDPILQVGSPGLFNQAFRRRGLEAVLVPAHVAPQDLARAVEGLRQIRNLGGLVVTVPHKIAIMELLDEIGPAASKIGAVNAIRRMADGRLVGENFDGAGCVRALRGNGQAIAGRHIFQLGAGGAGRAVAHALADEGPASLRIADLDRNRAGELVESLNRAHPALAVSVSAPEPGDADLVVNATPLGMRPEDVYPFDPAAIADGAFVVDVILKPPFSALLQAAQARGLGFQQGPAMLEGQIEAVCEFLTRPEGQS